MCGPGAGLLSAQEDLAEKGHAILRKRCGACHGSAVALSGLRMDSRESVLHGGSRGAAVSPGSATDSLLYRLVARRAEPAMPPTGAIPEAEVEVLRQWIDQGFVWPGATATEPAPAPSWWAFSPPRKPVPPAGADNAIDAFIQARLAQKGLQATGRADRRTLIRRVYYDLWGLPPTHEETAAFVADPSPDAWNKLVDRLLESPRYGEKWGQHWLDLVRYGDTAGFETDPYHLDSWRYRDYVIRSFNQDKPYDRFVQEQLAGDELWPEDADAVTATGFFRVGPHRDLQVKVEKQNRVEKLADYVQTTSEALLALTVGCARCHDHKFDPISQKDYHRMQAIFEPAINKRHMLQPLALLDEVNRTKREFRLYQIGSHLRELQAPYEKRLRDEKLKHLPEAVRVAFNTEKADRTPEQESMVSQYASLARVTDAEVRAALSDGDRERLEETERMLSAIFKGYGPPPFVDGIGDGDGEFPDSYVWIRGNPDARGDTVRAGFLSVLGGGEIPPSKDPRSTGRRTALARWLTDGKNPLVARVAVNRIWQWHFGRGLVPTASDFGIRSGDPSHPELLDWLAVTFVEQGWSFKTMHRMILRSEAYQRDWRAPESVAEKDPENVYLARFSRRRLSAEEVRDSVLVASGMLNLSMGGIPAVPPLEAEELHGIIGRTEEAWPVSLNPGQFHRRSIYLLSRRTFTQPMFLAFDKPDGILSCARRGESTTAPQSLTLLNSGFMVEQARRLAKIAPEPAAMWRRVLGRSPTAAELDWANEFIADQAAREASTAVAQAELARALLNLNEFLYVE